MGHGCGRPAVRPRPEREVRQVDHDRRGDGRAGRDSGTPAAAAPLRRAHERVGDAERDAVTGALAEHAALGRLTGAEHAERVGAALSARTHADLAPLLADLPPLPVPPAQRRAQAEASRRRRRLAAAGMVAPWALVCSGLWVLWLVLGAGYPWPVWPTLGWGVPTVLGAAAVLRGGGDGPPKDRPALTGERRTASDAVAA